MKKFLLLVMLLGVSLIGVSFWQWNGTSNWSCDWVELNTDIWNYVGIEDGCINKSEMEEGASLFGKTIAGIGKFVVQILVLVAFWLVIFGGVMIASSGAYEEGYTKGKAMIMKAIVGIILLWLMGTILYWLNPNFFKM